MPYFALYKLRRAWPLALAAVVVAAYRGALTLSAAGRVAGVFIIAVMGGAAGGLAYGLFGRHVRRVPTIGWYLAGITAVAPYAAVMVLLLRMNEHAPLLEPFTNTEWFVVGVMTMLFGAVIGRVWFSENTDTTRA